MLSSHREWKDYANNDGRPYTAVIIADNKNAWDAANEKAVSRVVYRIILIAEGINSDSEAKRSREISLLPR